MAKRLEKVRLGRTNLVVTRLGWGGIPIQRVDEQEAVSVLRALVDMGVDFLDTGRAYTNSEHRVGLALRQIDRPVILSSKSLVRTDRITRMSLRASDSSRSEKSRCIICTISPAKKNTIK